MSPAEPRDEPMWSSISKEDIDRIQNEIVTNRAQVARRARIVAIVAITTAIATTLVSVLLADKDQRIARLTGFPTTVPDRSIELAQLDKRIALTEAALQRTQPIVKDGKPALPADKLVALQEAQGKRLSALEAAIMSSPENAISVPLIKRDLEALRSENQAQIAFIKTDIDRIFAVGTWVLTGLFTVIAAIASWILTTLFPGKGKKEG